MRNVKWSSAKLRFAEIIKERTLIKATEAPKALQSLTIVGVMKITRSEFRRLVELLVKNQPTIGI